MHDGLVNVQALLGDEVGPGQPLPAIEPLDTILLRVPRGAHDNHVGARWQPPRGASLSVQVQELADVLYVDGRLRSRLPVPLSRTSIASSATGPRGNRSTPGGGASGSGAC